MKNTRTAYSRQYRAALSKRLTEGPKSGEPLADGMGSKALEEGLSALDLAKIHHEALREIVADGLPTAARGKAYGLAGKFLADAIRPIEKQRREAIKTAGPAVSSVQALKKELAATNRRLKRETEKRKELEKSLKRSKVSQSEALAQSQRLHSQMRHLSHRLIIAQEEERKLISRELHDQIAQLLTGINNHLAVLRLEDASKTHDFAKKITATQRLVEKSVGIVHRFARDLRPTLLDDLGLIPALKAHLKEFTKQSRLPVSFAAFAGVERLNADKKTVLYRVAQAALSNIAQHAKATHASLTITDCKGSICMEIADNGKSFNVERVLYAKRHERLGIIGMRERTEMVGGDFSLESAPGKGTTIHVRIPVRDNGNS